MQRKTVMLRSVMALGIVLLIAGRAAVSQTASLTASKPDKLFHSEVSIQGDAFITRASEGNDAFLRNTKAGGALVSYRYYFNRWLSAESVYGWNRDSHLFYTPEGSGRVQSDVHQATAGLVAVLPLRLIPGITPSFLAEGGALVYIPTNAAAASIPGAQQQAIGAFAYGGTMDIQVPGTNRMVFRLGNRTLVHKAPSFGLKALDTDSIVLTNEFTAGVAFRF